VFAPRREHARFCSARCRIEWDRGNASDRTAEVSALGWSITAMQDTAQRLLRVRPWDLPSAFAVIGEAVWWVTIVDGTLLRYHPESYDAVLTCGSAGERRLIEGTLAGLRFVRNQMGNDVDHVDFVRPASRGRGDGGITSWRWKPVPEPALSSLSPRGRAWEMTRYWAYMAQLAGNTIGSVFARAATFLELTAASATVDAGLSAHAAR
jgi:hypothetical protein